MEEMQAEQQLSFIYPRSAVIQLYILHPRYS